MSYTPEPWKFISYDLHGVLITSIECGDECLADDIDPSVGERIVACVNACAGMRNPIDEIAKLKSEHIEMLSALKDILSINWSDGLKGLDRPTDFAERQEAIRALGKAKDIARKAILTLKGGNQND